MDTNPASGTRDFLAGEVTRRRAAFQALRTAFERHGFQPLDTPAFERLEILAGKYGEEGDQLMFKILRRGKHEATGEADLALRYDLTVPLARVVAQYSDQTIEPFRRYQLAPVWRADRPGRGRFREFTQCDVDIVGSAAPLADAEVILAVVAGLTALGVEQFDLQLNSRRALRGLIEAYGVPLDREQTTLTALDKLDKIGADGVVAELRKRGVPEQAVARIGDDLTADELTDRARQVLAETERGRTGLAEVDVVATLVAPNLPAGVNLSFAPLLARGLDYYTGVIFEVHAGELNTSVASGGRYDELIGMFSNRDIPATGGSVGLERVLLLLDDDPGGAQTSPEVLVTVFDAEAAAGAAATASRLRAAGLTVDLYAGAGGLGKQLRYADRRDIRWCVLRGPDERAAGTYAVKDMATGEQTEVDAAALVDHLRARVH